MRLKKESKYRTLILAVLFFSGGHLLAQKKPNILVIFGDDIGQSEYIHVSAKYATE
jgi:hypothetical protein